MIIKELTKIQGLSFLRANCNSLRFDGVNEDLLVTPTTNFNFQWTDAWSIEAWIYVPSTSGLKFAFSKWRGGATSKGWFFMVIGAGSPSFTGVLRLQLRQAASGYIDAYSTSSVNFDQWNHVAVTYDGSGTNAGITFYINNVATTKPNTLSTQGSGTPIGSGSISSGTIQTTEPTTVNSLVANGNWSDGDLESTKVYNVELTAADITELYTRRSIPKVSNLLLDLNVGRSGFNGTEWEVPDVTGNNTAISRNMEVDDLTTNCPMKGVVSCYSLDFDGVNEYVNCTDNNAFSFGSGGSDSPFSMSVWINMDDATNCRMMSKFISAGGREYWFGTTSDDTILFALYNSFSDTRFVYVKSTVPLSENTWINVTVTYDGRGGLTAFDGQEIYVDGQLQSKTTFINGNYQSMSNKSAPLEIGAITSLGNYANAKFASARMWNVELSASETLAYYNETNAATSIQTSALVVDADFNASVFNGSEFNIPDPTGTTSGYTSVNLEIEDKVEDCPS
jgi:hypothetical protein